MPTTSKISKKARKGQFDWPTFLDGAKGRVPDFDGIAPGDALPHYSKWAQPAKNRESTLSQ